MKAVQSPPAAATPSRLKNIVRGKIARPVRALVYGIEGVGKSTFASNAPSPIYLTTEDGTSQLDVARLPEPTTWADVLETVRALETDEHDFRTLVIDTLDWLEPLCWAAVCARPDEHGKIHRHIESFGFGKGYVVALTEWRILLAALERLRAARSMHVVMLAHSWIKPFKNPEGEDYDRWEMKLHAKAGGLLKEWSDAVLFASYETHTYESGGRNKGVSTGARVLHTQRRAAWDAKNRYDLPETLPLDWDAFFDAVQAHRPADPAALRTRIDRMLETADEQLKTRVTAAVTRANGNPAELARIADKLSATITIAKEESAK